MRKIEIGRKLPKFSNIFSNLNFIFFSFVFLIMLIFAVLFGGTVYDSYEQAKINEQKTAEMEKYIEDWTEKSEAVNKAPMHPVKLEDLDKVQTILLTSIKQYGLNITGFTSEKKIVTPQNAEQNNTGQLRPNQNNNNFHDYELNIEGSYSGIVKFLNSIHQNNILISIRSLQLQQQKGIMKADVKYRVYTK